MRRPALILCLLLLLPAVSAAPRSLGYGFEPSYSPDGREMVYAAVEDGVRDIFLIDEAGRRSRLTSDIYWDGQPVFTADGRGVVFVSDRSGKRELWQVDIATGALEQLTHGDGWKSHPSVSRDGRVVFTSGRHPDLDLYVLEGGAVRRLTYLEDEIYSPVWSPDGGRIAFVREGELMVIKDDGTGLEHLASEVYSRGLAWSGEGRIFYLRKGAGYDLWSVRADDPDREELIYEGVTDSWEVDPAVSGEGDVAFSTDKDGFYTIYVIDAAIPPAYLGAPPEPAPNPAIEPVESLAISEDPADTGQRIDSPEEDELEVPAQGEDRNEIVIPDPDAPDDRNVIVDEDRSGFMLLAGSALLLLLAIQGLEKRKPLYRL
ncbi:MAG: hypothetical protein D6733_02575 [Methanobacteriota archaeon]|nr:MAG: hypothetical protein D6733_02575 [Euryarchaeota archaeon]